MEKRKKEDKKEFVDLMVRKAYSKDPKAEAHVSKLEPDKDPEVKPHKSNLKVEEVEEITEKVRNSLDKKRQPK
ncbi:MAG: hypothetical protein QGF74_03510 [Candidatus Nanoarchaeia archaeon]|jgi:hypothetical protein|nr:hypothetical protein [Candidatus Nanoarchaeia archaeon]|tara:strand:- start:41334 stop:41552 length:219 start_codon:yes stop_codon:yes gene_type:complete